MRFYELTLTDPKSGEVWQPSPTGDGLVKTRPGSGPSFSTHDNGILIPGALILELDVPNLPFNQPAGSAFLRLWGIGLPSLGQAADLNGQNIRLLAGMKSGLPLANPNQAGLILQGTIFQSYGLWQGMNQTLELICYPPAADDDQALTFDWPKGTSLSSALLVTFRQAFSKYRMTFNVEGVSDLVQNFDEKGGRYTRLTQFGQWLQQRTEKIGSAIYGSNYSGVVLTIVGNTLYAFDNVRKSPVKQLEFQDFVAQPTWIDSATINFKMVMRGDLSVGSRVKFPSQGFLAPYILTTTNAAVPNAPSRSKTVFQGVFTIIRARHFGNSRQPDADSWVTSFDAVPE